MSDHGDSMRCDVWLFRTRFYKSRGLAGQMVEKGAVRIDRNGKVVRLTKPAAPVRPGDCLVIRRDPEPIRLTVLALPERRGPAPEARSCYSLETE